MKLYLAGPMRGYPEFNFPAFHAAAKSLRERGHEVWSPAENDVEQDGFDPKTDQPKGMSHYMERDLPAVCWADAVAVLPGWSASECARLECYVAKALKKQVLDAESLLPVESVAEVKDEALKFDGEKPPMGLLPWEALREVAAVLGFGAKKYAAHNWRKGFHWSRLLDAALRHLSAFATGERIDPESGKSHLAHAACMILFLLTHQLLGIGTDDVLPETKRSHEAT